jgi:hypothetical protein
MRAAELNHNHELLFGLACGQAGEAAAQTRPPHLATYADCRPGAVDAAANEFVDWIRKTPRIEALAAIVARELPPEDEHAALVELGDNEERVVYLASNRHMDRLEALTGMERSLLDRPAKRNTH